MDEAAAGNWREQSSERMLTILGVLWLLLAAAIVVSQFSKPPRIIIEWQTATEVNTAGFNILRATAEDGPFSKINDSLIPSNGSAVSGATYSFVDDEVVPDQRYYYRLEDVELDNSSQQHDLTSEEAPALAPWWVLVTIAFCIIAGLLLLVKGLKAEKGR